jgi:hypothetical protein
MGFQGFWAGIWQKFADLRLAALSRTATEEPR